MGPGEGDPGCQAAVAERAESATALTVPSAPSLVLYGGVVSQATEKIEALLARLEDSGADPRRLEVLRATQRFKRSWVELAESLVAIRREKAHEDWGYADFHKYCADELHLRRSTVDKLTISFSTLKRLAPQVLQWDGVEREVPSLQAVDYFGKAVQAANVPPAEGKQPTPPSREVIKDLRKAVFDEGQSVAELRRRFDPILRPKPKGAEELEVISKALGATRKLAELLPEIEGLTDRCVTTVEKALGGLRQDLEALAEPLRVKTQAQKKPPKRAQAPKKAHASRKKKRRGTASG